VSPPLLNKTLDYADLADPAVRPTLRSLKRFVRSWLLSGERLGVNGAVKRRWYVRRHKLWEYARGLALTDASAPRRAPGRRFDVLDIGGAMTLPVFYLASLGDRVVCLDIDARLVTGTNEIARRRGLDVDARTTNLVEVAPRPEDLGAPSAGFDRVYSFCVIEHILPPGQARVAARMAELLRPGGLMCVTFDYGEHAPTEAPMHTRAHLDALRAAIGLPLAGNADFAENGALFPLNRRHPDRRYTFGSLFFRRPDPGGPAPAAPSGRGGSP
jgi:SAM-dependent methyltransferase